jgi:hypothetical protein
LKRRNTATQALSDVKKYSRDPYSIKGFSTQHSTADSDSTTSSSYYSELAKLQKEVEKLKGMTTNAQAFEQLSEDFRIFKYL